MPDRTARRYQRFCLKNGKARHRFEAIQVDRFPESIAVVYECKICHVKRVVFRQPSSPPQLSDLFRHARHTLKFDEIVVTRLLDGTWLHDRTYQCVKCLQRIGSIEISAVE